MQEKKFVRTLRIAKVIQLCALLVIELSFFLILLCNPSLSRQLYSNQPLFALCAVVWVLMLFHFACLIYDFSRLRSFATESHELNQIAYLDSLTGIPNRHGLDYIFRTYNSPDSMTDLGCCVLTISNLVAINEKAGRKAGDALIQDFCAILEDVGDSIGTVGRNGGNEFLFVMDGCTEGSMAYFLNLLNQKIESYNEAHPRTYIDLQSAWILNSEAKLNTISELLIETYNKLYSQA